MSGQLVPFGVDHIRGSLDPGLIVYPPKVAKKSLRWGWRLCRPDFTSSHQFRWPFPGNWAHAPGPILDHSGDCCREVGDGICAAHTIGGAQSAGARMAGSVGLLVAWTDGDVLGESLEKTRLRRAWVAAIFDPLQHLTGADLTGAYLTGAYLTRADLTGAYLTGADLTGAYLTRAYLTGANLTRADLYGANLTGAYLTGAYLTGAYLTRADLYGANLTGADLSGAKWDERTVWPVGFDPTAAGAVRR